MSRSFYLYIFSGVFGLCIANTAVAGTAQCIADVSTYGLPVIGYFEGEPTYSNLGNYGRGCQCVEFINRALGVSDIDDATGYASSIYAYMPTTHSEYTAYPNGGSVAPAYGDIIVWSGNTYGHVGIISRGYDGSSTIQVVDQNRAYTTGSSDGYMNCSVTLGTTYLMDCYPALGRDYTILGWLHDTTNDPPPCTDVDYPINLVVASPDSVDYDLDGYYVSGTGTSTTLVAIDDPLYANTGNVSTHKVWLAGDVTGDGFDDIVEIYDSGSYTYAYVYISDGVGGLSVPTSWVKTTTGIYTSSSKGVNTAFLEDMDDDGDADLILGYKNSDLTMKWKTYTSTGSSFGGTTNGTIWSSSFGKYTDLFQMGDYKDNEKGELLCGREADGTNDYTFSSALTWKRLASTGGTSTVSTGYGYSGDAFFSSDVNIDGPEDLVRVDLYDGTVSVYMEQYSSGSSAFGSASKLATDVGGVNGTYFMYPIDPGDDYPDLLRLNSTGDLYISRNTSGSALTTKTSETIMISGMPTSNSYSYLFGNFGNITICE